LAPDPVEADDLPLFDSFSKGQSCPQVGHVFKTLAPQPPQKEAD
jgi:hypothetical protein